MCVHMYIYIYICIYIYISIYVYIVNVQTLPQVPCCLNSPPVQSLPQARTAQGAQGSAAGGSILL